MRKLLRKVAGIVVAIALVFAPMVGCIGTVGTAWATVVTNDADGGGDSVPASETDGSETKAGDNLPETSILPNNWDIETILKFILNLLVYGLGVAAVLGVIIAAIMYLTARDNEQQVAKAKTRLYEVVIGLVAWAVMFALLQWLIPGGVNLS